MLFPRHHLAEFLPLPRRRVGFHRSRSKPPDLVPVAAMGSCDLRQVYKQKPGGEEWICASSPAGDHAEFGVLNRRQHFRPMNHGIVACDEALDPARLELTNEFVIVIAEQGWVDLLERHDSDVERVGELPEGLPQDRLGEALVQDEEWTARQLDGDCARADPPDRPRLSRSPESVSDRAR